MGFAGDGWLKKVSLVGGPAINICPVSSDLRGASWGADGTIVFAERASGGLFRVSAVGGEPEILTTLDEGQGEIAHRWPEILPGGRAVLFTVAHGVRIEDRQIVALNFATGEQLPLIPVGSGPRYSPTGHLVYGVGGTLRAVSFDLERLVITGDPVPVLDDVMTKSTELGNPGLQDGAVNFSLAQQDGSLVYVSNVPEARPRSLVWIDRQGQEEPLALEPRNYAMARISPDGTQVAIDRRDEENDIWIWNIARETMTQLTFGPTPDFLPAWTPDGHVVFSSRREGARAQLFMKAADGTGTAERLTDSPVDLFSKDVSSNGQNVVFTAASRSQQSDLRMFTMDGERVVEGLLETPSSESNATVSPDGRWLAYQSNESGETEIYLRPFPDIDGGKWVLSTDGGTGALWSRDGREVFYRSRAGNLMTVTVSTDAGSLVPRFGRAAVLLEGSYLSGGYDVSSDGQRFLVIREDSSSSDSSGGPDIILIQNWFEELKRLVPTN